MEFIAVIIVACGIGVVFLAYKAATHGIKTWTTETPTHEGNWNKE